jgi:adenylyltransferase/sulfurtransferase
MLRYQKQILLPEIGIYGQNKIADACVLIVGAGGLGTPVATYLTAIGVGKISIFDFDCIHETNLHRQFVYTRNDIGKNKAAVLAFKLRKQNLQITIENYSIKIDESNANEVINKYQIICDCSDNFETRLLLDKVCSNMNKPLIYGAVRDWQGYITVLNFKKKIRLTDIFSKDEMILYENNNCTINGIVSTICGIVGSYQANEVLKLILNLETILDGSILCIDALNHNNKILKLKKDPCSRMIL